jgi:hypothetical protein
LGIGTTGQVLTVAGGVPSWATPSSGTAAFVGCKLTSSLSPSISNNTYTTLAWDGETFDTNTFHDNSTNNSRITIPAGKAGKYQITAFVLTGNNASGYSTIQIKRNGTTDELGFATTNSTQYPSLLTTGILNLAEGDYIQAIVWQNSGTTQTFYQSGSFGGFSATYLGA